MIEIKGVSKKYGELTVLKDVNLTVEKGKLTTLLGPSGAGKSSLLNIVGMLDKPDEGSVFLDGVNISSLSAKELARFRNQNIGFVFQFHQLLPEFTALENVCMPAWIGKKNEAESEKRAKELLDFMGLSERMDHKPSALSGGEAQRVAVARALMNQPKIILADEPSGNLDSQRAHELHELFRKLSHSGEHTFLVVTHNEQLAALSDRSVHMADGKILGSVAL